MGASGISIWQLLIVLLIVVLVFGTKRLKNLGGDLGGAIKSFRKGMTEAEKAETEGVERTQGCGRGHSYAGAEASGQPRR